MNYLLTLQRRNFSFCNDASYGLVPLNDEFIFSLYEEKNLSKTKSSYRRLLIVNQSIRRGLELELTIDQAINQQCQWSSTGCPKIHLEVKQGNSKRNILQLHYFLDSFGDHFHHRIEFLQLSRSARSDITVKIMPHICNIRYLHFFKDEYNKKSSEIVFSALLNCSQSKIDHVVFTSVPRNNLETIEEKALRNLHTVGEIAVRIETLSIGHLYTVVKLLQMNVIEHRNLPLFRLKKIKIVTNHLDSRICQRSILRDLILYLEEIKIVPFNGYKLNKEVFEYCKKIVIDIVVQASNITKLNVFKLQNWQMISRGKNLWYFENEKITGKEKMTLSWDLLYKMVLSNVMLINGAFVATLLMFYWEDFCFICMVFYEEWDTILHCWRLFSPFLPAVLLCVLVQLQAILLYYYNFNEESYLINLLFSFIVV